jgi:sulfur carrier protein ThiS
VKIRVKLYANLDQYLPAGGHRNEADMEVEPATTPASVFSRLGLPAEFCHLVLVNGIYVAPADRASQALQEGDHLAVWPPVAGG